MNATIWRVTGRDSPTGAGTALGGCEGGGLTLWGSGRHMGLVVRSSAGSGHQEVGGYGLRTILAKQVDKTVLGRHTYLLIVWRPVLEPRVLDIDSFPA